MHHPGFFDRVGPFSLDEIAHAAGAKPARAHTELLADIRPLSDAKRSHVSFIDNRKYLAQLETTEAAAVFVAPAFQDRVPASSIPLVTREPYHAFARVLALFYPTSMTPMVSEPGAPALHPSAKLEDGVLIEPNVVIGPGAEIGRGTRIASGAVIGARCTVGRDCYIGASVTVTHALIGDRVTIHSGVRIGQDGFGFAMGKSGHLKVPQIGRVIIQDDVEIGANTTIDRGALKDTIIGEGTKIDNLVQIGHNVVIGRNCVIVAFAGVAGSAELGDFVVLGGQAGVSGHIKVGSGAQIGGTSHPTHDVPAGARYFGTPAKPLKEAAREMAALKRLAARAPHDSATSGGGNADD